MKINQPVETYTIVKAIPPVTMNVRHSVATFIRKTLSDENLTELQLFYRLGETANSNYQYVSFGVTKKIYDEMMDLGVIYDHEGHLHIEKTAEEWKHFK